MIEIVRTNAADPVFQELVKQLDKELMIRDGADHAFYAQFNKTDAIKYAVVAYDGNLAAGCGAIKTFTADTMEVKRMYVTERGRNKGIASLMLGELEQWSRELSCTKCVLETGINQPEAISLYAKNGYHRINNYGQYENIATSFCFGKEL